MPPRHHLLIAILPCNDVETTLRFYERLGFKQTGGDDQYAMLKDGKGGELHLQPAVEGWLVPAGTPFVFTCTPRKWTLLPPSSRPKSSKR